MEKALATRRWIKLMGDLDRSNEPLPSSFVAFNFKCRQRANRCSLYRPECARSIIGSIPAIANAIPPSTCFTPARENGVNTKTPTLKGELNRRCHGSDAIGKDFMGWTYLAHRYSFFEQMFEK
jgi:hypothetical protein